MIAYHHRASLGQRAFTLVELIVTFTIVAILASLTMVVLARVQDSGKLARDVHAGRQLVAAYLAAAADQNGQLLAAHYEGRADGISDVHLPDGKTVSGAALHRYPYRLARYLNYKLEGTILVNDNVTQIRENFKGSLYDYGVSLCPAFGINYYFVGGYYVDGEIQGAAECVTHLGQAEKPSSLLVFATAFTEVNNQRIEGRFGVEPPYYRAKLWDSNLHVDARHSDKAVCAFLDGSVRNYTIEELRDMRLWSKNAAAENNPRYTVAVTGNSGIGGGGRR